MSLEELSQLYYLKKKIEMDEREIEDMRTQAENFTVPLTLAKPSNKHSDGSRVERSAVEIADRTRILDAKLTQYRNERAKIEEYIDGIKDYHMQLIFKYRFVECLSWNEVADKIGGKNTDASVKMACYRYLVNEI